MKHLFHWNFLIEDLRESRSYFKEVSNHDGQSNIYPVIQTGKSAHLNFIEKEGNKKKEKETATLF